MTANTTMTIPTAPTEQRCRGACKQVRPLFDFYSLGTNATDPRMVCKECWKAVNAVAYKKRQTQRIRRTALALALAQK